MSLPKSKMLSASKAILAIAAKGRYEKESHKSVNQTQTVNINIKQNQPTTATVTPSPAAIITSTRPDEPVKATESIKAAEPATVKAAVKERSVELPEPAAETIIDTSTTPAATTAAYKADPAFSGEDLSSAQEELDNLYAMLNNYETVAKALILIIDLLESNPLIVNKIIVPNESTFKELLKILTSADEVEFKYHEEVTCSLSSKKYKLIDDIIIIKNTEPKSLKYSHPDVTRLLDRFNISTKMIVKDK